MEKDKKQVQTKNNRKEYTQANLNWLASKSKETGVSPLPKGSVTNHWPKDGLTANIPAHEASSPSTTPAVPSTEEYSTTHGEESRLPSG